MLCGGRCGGSARHSVDAQMCANVCLFTNCIRMRHNLFAFYYDVTSSASTGAAAAAVVVFETQQLKK